MSTKSDDEVEPFELDEKVQVRVRREPNKLLWIVTVVVLVVVVMVALAVGLGVGLGVGLRSSEEERCQTAECIQLAAVVMSGIDASVDPCQDFYNFSCGNWINTVPNITEYLFFSVSDLAQERSQRALVNALTVEDSSDIEAVRKAKDLYHSCIDRDSISSYGAAPLLDVINQTGENHLPSGARPELDAKVHGGSGEGMQCDGACPDWTANTKTESSN